MIPFEWISQAAERIAPQIICTPLTHDAVRGLYIKWENRQLTGSFKVRGALNKVLSLEDWEREAGIVAASAGNHGLGVAFAGQLTKSSVEVFVSEHAVPAKVEAMRELGAQIHFVKGGYPQAEAVAKVYAEEQQKTWVSPYNDGQIIAGQGTIGLEILESPLMEKHKTEIMEWLVPVSGGGLIAGIGASIREQAHRPRLIGVQAENSAFMHNLYYRNTQENVSDLPSLADGLTGEVEQGSVTIPMVKQTVDEIVLVSEEEIARAMAFAWQVYGEKIEGSGAVGLAAVLSGKVTVRPILVIVSGGNVQPEVHAEIVARYAEETWA